MPGFAGLAFGGGTPTTEQSTWAQLCPNETIWERIEVAESTITRCPDAN